VENPVCDPIIQELKAMKQRMDVLFDETLNDEASDEDDSGAVKENWSPSMDVWETQDEWLLQADLPGVPDESLRIEVADGVLTISGSRRSKEFPPHAAVHASERPCGSFERSFLLPTDAHQDRIHAELKRGILTVRASRVVGGSETSRKIAVQPE
jgi:HSP20 family protein